MADRVLIYKKDRGEYILNGLCEFWGIDRQGLLKLAHNNPTLTKRKNIAIYMLYYIADYKLKDIAEIMGYKSNTLYALTNMRERTAELLNKTYGDKDTIEEYQRILKHLGL